MGKSIRSKRQKALRSIKRKALEPREDIILAQKAAVIARIKGEHVDPSTIPQLPEKANAPHRFQFNRQGAEAHQPTFDELYQPQPNHIDAWNKKKDEERLKIKEEQKEQMKNEDLDESKEGEAPKRRGRDRRVKNILVGKHVANIRVKKEGQEMNDVEEEEAEVENDQIRYGEFGKPVLSSRARSKARTSAPLKKKGFLNWNKIH